jgi:hypothetical protein
MINFRRGEFVAFRDYVFVKYASVLNIAMWHILGGIVHGGWW